jgi:hypothetical protein
MIVNGKQYGELVEGTYLEFLGRAPRLSSTSRAAMGWYHCTRCGEIKMIRRQDVKPGGTVSCGCKGRKQFAQYHEDIAAKIAPATRKAVFESAYALRRRRVERAEIARRLHLTRYVVDFLIAAHQRFILATAALGKQARSLLSHVELRWLPRISSRYAQRKALAERKAMLNGMTCGERESFLDGERERERAAWEHVQAEGGFFSVLQKALDNPDTEIVLS